MTDLVILHPHAHRERSLYIEKQVGRIGKRLFGRSLAKMNKGFADRLSVTSLNSTEYPRQINTGDALFALLVLAP